MCFWWLLMEHMMGLSGNRSYFTARWVGQGENWAWKFLEVKRAMKVGICFPWMRGKFISSNLFHIKKNRSSVKYIKYINIAYILYIICKHIFYITKTFWETYIFTQITEKMQSYKYISSQDYFWHKRSQIEIWIFGLSCVFFHLKLLQGTYF